MLKGTTINDNIHGMITLSPYERSVIYTPEYFRLHDVHQSSTLFMTYPTNRTMRYEHSIGTMKLCSDMYFSSVLNADQETLEVYFEQARYHVSQIIHRINESAEELNCFIAGNKVTDFNEYAKHVPLDRIRYSYIPSNVSEENRILQVILMETIRTGALLHDIGHPPFSHIIEHSISRSYLEVNEIPADKQTIRQKKFLKDMNLYFQPEAGQESPKPLHEKMGDMIADNLLTNVVELYSREEKDLDVKTETIFSLIIKYCVLSMFHEKPFFADLHRIIDSSVDGDRLDYVSRDMKNSGIDCGIIEYPRIINGMKLLIPEKEKIIFAFSEKCTNTIEDFLKRRFILYKDINFHHHAVKTDFLLEQTVKYLILDYLRDHSRDELSDNTNNLIPFDISGIWYPLTEEQVKLTKKNASNLLQWNDSWLMTVLKQLYYSGYQADGQATITRQLHEFLCNGKEYYSLTKRLDDFYIIDDEIRKQLKTEGLQEPYRGFSFREVMRHPDRFDLSLNKLKEIVRRAAYECAQEVYGPGAIQDIIVAWPVIKSGAKQKIYLYKDDQIYVLQDRSGIVNVLELQIRYIQPFYLYLMFTDQEQNRGDDPVMKRKYLCRIGEEITRELNHRVKGK